MKQTINQFTKGLITELHPLMTDGTQLTDALNATLVTYNGNEFMLQNDMGNTLIQDSKTGHIMGLSEGFIPVGTKEHGGIMYIVSADKHGNGEIGTIPSPILTVSLRAESYNDSTLSLCDNNGPKISESIISNENIFPGEKFIVVLNLQNTNEISTIQLPNPDIPPKSLISKVNEKGLYNIELYTVTSNSTISLINKCEEAQQYVNASGLKNSDYWFIDGVDDTINPEQTYKGGYFKTYPGNLPPGRLAIKVKLERILSFGFIKSKQPLALNREEELDAPEIYFDSTDKSYHLLFPGFYYTTDSARYVKKIKMSVQNQLTGEIWLNDSEFILDKFDYLTKYDGKIFEFRHVKQNESLVNVSIGSVLNQWIKVRVEQYDQYDGKIDVLTYSFNPYHIINYQSLFFNPQLVPTVTTQQYYDISNSNNDIQLSMLHFGISEDIQFINPRSYSFSLGSIGDITDNECVEFVDYEENTSVYYPVITSNDVFSSNQKEEKSSFVIPALNLKYLVQPITVCYDYPIPHISVHFSDRGVISQDPDSKDSAIVEVYAGGFNYGSICQYKDGQYPGYYDKMTWNGSQICIVSSYTQEGGFGKYIHNSEENGQFEYNQNITINGHGASFVGMDSYDASAKAKNIEWNGGARIITIGVEGNNDPLTDSFKYAENQSFSNKSIYQVHEGFEIFAENEEGDQVLIGFDKNGEVKEAMNFGSNLINETIAKDNNSIISSLYSNKKYLSKNSYIEKILNKGVYLLCFNYGFVGYGYATIIISDKSYLIPNFNNIIEPTLIYIPKKSTIKIKWDNLYQLCNIGLYKVDSTIKYLDIEDITTEEEPVIISYHDDNIKTEIILPAQLTYVEDAQCYQKTYEYYCGTKEPYYLDQIIYTNKNGEKVSESLIYKFDDNSKDLTETQILSPILSESLGLTKTIKYRITNELS